MNFWQKPGLPSSTQSGRTGASTTFRPTPLYPWISDDQFKEVNRKSNTQLNQAITNIPLRARSRINDFFKIDNRHIIKYYPKYVVNVVDNFSIYNLYCNAICSTPLSTVCFNRSTVYNTPRVRNWLKRIMYANVTYEKKGTRANVRPVWFDLRFYIYTVGRSEECHQVEFNTWRSYVMCSLLRNQRMEYLIPKYPLHQVGYRFRFTGTMDESRYLKDSKYRPREDWHAYWNNIGEYF